MNTAFEKGSVHDYKLLQNSGIHIHEEITIIGDSGYTGLEKKHKKTVIPRKKSKNKPLSKEDKTHNRSVAKIRVLIEHIIRMIKRFKVVSERYRNRRRRFEKHFNFISSIYNYELE